MLRGKRATQLCEAVLAELKPILPPGWNVTVGRGRGARVTATRRPREPVGGVGVPFFRWAGDFGIGLGPPMHRLLPSRIAAETVTKDAVRSIQAAVSSPEEPWPGPGMKPRSRLDGQTVHLWFESADGRRIDIGSIPSDLIL